MTAIRRASGTALAAGLLVATLTGCGHGKPAAAKTHEVYYLTTSTTGPFSVQESEGFRFGAGRVPGAIAKVVGPQTMDTIKQVQMLQQLIKDPLDSLSVTMVGAEAFTDSFAAATKKGITLVAIDTTPVGSDIHLFVGNDNYDLGQHLAGMVAAALPVAATGNVILGSPRVGVAVLDARALGFQDEMRKLRPRVHVVGPLDTSDRPDAAKLAWRRLALANPHALAMASVGADGAVLAGLKQSEHATWTAAAFDIDPDSLRAVKRGDLLLISPEHFLEGAVAGQLQAEYASRGTELPGGWVFIAGVPVTKQNVDEIIAREATVATRQAWFGPVLQQVFGQHGPEIRPMDQAR